jgi:hypothetical protein
MLESNGYLPVEFMKLISSSRRLTKGDRIS